MTTPGQSPRRSLGALVIPAVLAATGTFLVVGNQVMEEAGPGGLFGARTFPWMVAALCFVVAAVMAVDVLRPRHGAEPAEADDSVNWRALLVTVGGVVLFLVSLETLGWLLAATLLFAIVAVGLGSRHYVTSLVAGLGLASLIQVVFSGLLGLSLPAGLLGGL